ncbi:hypothetical protein [Burkholderia aenigmatica]|uniref:hypothetical protein n=1 Tax=Burkholderia aenigmatica TaxID=2015348 RepID=UPI002653190A|nr:hypothetical protein [Burkholderia aenigmatica]MDN7880051.1 hypothetical protein [Burkholderia aenigmatica]
MSTKTLGALILASVGMYAYGGSVSMIDGAALARAASMPAASMVITEADQVPVRQRVVDGKIRVTLDGRLVECDGTGQAYEVTIKTLVFRDPVWKNGKPVKFRRDMFLN